MSKIVYCANCGTRLNIARKALPKFGKIIEIVEYHECTDEPVDFDLTPVNIPTFGMTPGKDKFVQKINDLSPQAVAMRAHDMDEELRDRRFEDKTSDGQVKTTAPQSILGMIDKMIPTESERELIEEEGDEEGIRGEQELT